MARMTDSAQRIVYIVKDSGVRCLTTPCPVYRAVRENQPEDAGVEITDLDLSALGLDEEQRATLLKSTRKTGPGLKVEASVSTVPHAGPAGDATVLRIHRVF